MMFDQALIQALDFKRHQLFDDVRFDPVERDGGVDAVDELR